MQDDDNEKAKVINQMDLIYSNALLTIISGLEGKANSGLLGSLPGFRKVEGFDTEKKFDARDSITDRGYTH
ncbi:hypothetical protein BZA77DRAFT_361969 [Pyronema omphalodes]|nr:hypothetical protein BZA77DRAFT_361969 [Pyronema omphalodes]